MKYLGIDYGTKKVGLATSDDSGEFAFPYTILPASTHLFDEILKVVEREHIQAIVVGKSVATNNASNIIAQDIDQFSKSLQKRLTIPVCLEREDFSSVEAHRYQTKAGNRDDSAAAIILQRFLDRLDK